MLSRTRYSLCYLATYLMLAGIAFLLVPDASLRAFFARRTYDPTFVRFTGSCLIALSAVVIQIIRYRLEVLYPTTIGLRLFLVACFVWFYASTDDPLFLVILGVVLVGLVSTSVSLLLDRSRGRGKGSGAD